jgi:hypothetical protein
MLIHRTPLRSAAILSGAIGLVASCAGQTSQAPDPNVAALEASANSAGTSIEVSELDIVSDQIDRFLHCPPPGELGQDWIPPLPSWTPPAATAPVDSTSGVPPPATVNGATGTDKTMSDTDKAIADTRESFRTCYNHGLVYDPTQDGHVAIVLRVGPDGRVGKVESWGACEIVSETIDCMRAVAKKLRFPSPPSGSDTITIPAVFTSSAAVRRTSPRSSDVYTAAAYIALEKLRPQLHACEQSARQAGRPVIASATFNLDLDGRGKVLRSNIDPWTGDKNLLACAANALNGLGLPPPPGGKANVILRLAFNPRAGTK